MSQPTATLMVHSRVSGGLIPLRLWNDTGAESVIYEVVGDPRFVYAAPRPATAKELALYCEKVEALIALKPRLGGDAVVPLEILYDPADPHTPVAVKMARVPNAVTLDDLIITDDPDQLASWELDDRVAVARQVVRVFARFRAENIFPGDNHAGNFMAVTCDRLKQVVAVKAIDSQRYTFHWGRKAFGCPCMAPGQLAPERQGLPYPAREALTQFDTAFALGLLLFRILFLAEAFDFAEPNNPHATPDERVQAKQFALLSMPKGATVTSKMEDEFLRMPPRLLDLLYRALMAEPTKRPTPLEWDVALKAAWLDLKAAGQGRAAPRPQRDVFAPAGKWLKGFISSARGVALLMVVAALVLSTVVFPSLFSSSTPSDPEPPLPDLGAVAPAPAKKDSRATATGGLGQYDSLKLLRESVPPLPSFGGKQAAKAEEPYVHLPPGRVPKTVPPAAATPPGRRPKTAPPPGGDHP
jgi:DNA-binding helix-hairpin-helix protein with protein kinase domain